MQSILFAYFNLPFIIFVDIYDAQNLPQNTSIHFMINYWFALGNFLEIANLVLSFSSSYWDSNLVLDE